MLPDWYTASDRLYLFLYEKYLSQFQNKSVILLQAKQYSPLFLRRIIQKISKLRDLEIKKIDLDQDFSDIQRSLQTSFLGQTHVYWFSDLSLISSKNSSSNVMKFIEIS